MCVYIVMCILICRTADVSHAVREVCCVHAVREVCGVYALYIACGVFHVSHMRRIGACGTYTAVASHAVHWLCVYMYLPCIVVAPRVVHELCIYSTTCPVVVSHDV